MDLSTLAVDSKYVSITTFRKDGTPRATPVWIVDLGDREVGFTSGLDSFKVKRIADNPSVELRASDVRGRVEPHGPVVAGTARVVTGQELDRVREAIKKKYGVAYTATKAWEKTKQTVKRESPADDRSCAVIVSAAS